MAVVDRDLRFIRVNHAFGMFQDRDPSEIVGTSVVDALPDLASQIEQVILTVFATGEPIIGQEVIARDPADPDNVRWFRVNRYPIFSAGRSVSAVVSMFVDVTDLRSAQIQLDDALALAEENHLSELANKRAQLEALGRYRTIFEGASIGILRVEADGRMVEANPAMERMLGYTASELAEMDLRRYTHPEDVEYNLALFRELMAGKRDSYQLEKRCYRKSGELVWIQVTAAVERDAQGKPKFAISMLENITERKVAQEALFRQAELSEHQALHDGLTGLPNRRKLYNDMERILAGLSERETVAIGLFDLDGFKAYNDTFGHPAGDVLLARLGRRLATTLEGRGTAYRMGGDEFCVLTHSSSDPETALADACAALGEQGERFTIRCSRGSVELPGEAETLERALQLADERLYADKRARRRTVSLDGRDALVQLIAEQDQDLATHGLNVGELAAATATKLGLSAEDIACTRVAAELHDIGKTAIPEAILSKPGPLDDHEWEFIKRHTLIGERILAAAPALARIAPIVRSSHERPDGSGYPDGLNTDAIPLGARIVAVVDAFDAMVASRPYRPARGIAEAVTELRRCAGTQFDRAVVDAFIDVIQQVKNQTRAA